MEMDKIHEWGWNIHHWTDKAFIESFTREMHKMHVVSAYSISFQIHELHMFLDIWNEVMHHQMSEIFIKIQTFIKHQQKDMQTSMSIFYGEMILKSKFLNEDFSIVIVH